MRRPEAELSGLILQPRIQNPDGEPAALGPASQAVFSPFSVGLPTAELCSGLVTDLLLDRNPGFIFFGPVRGQTAPP